MKPRGSMMNMCSCEAALTTCPRPFILCFFFGLPVIEWRIVQIYLFYFFETRVVQNNNNNNNNT